MPWAHFNPVKLPDEISDDQAILMSDIFPTGWFGADLADIEEGHTVAAFGCGPVAQFSIASAKVVGGRVIAADCLQDRLAMARSQGAEIVNFEQEDPVETILALTGGSGADRAIDAVGADAQHGHEGHGGRQTERLIQRLAEEQSKIEPHAITISDRWIAGDAPSQALDWPPMPCGRRASSLRVPDRQGDEQEPHDQDEKLQSPPIRRYYATVIDLVLSGAIDPVKVLGRVEPMRKAVEAHEAFDRRDPGWLKVELEPDVPGAA